MWRRLTATASPLRSRRLMREPSRSIASTASMLTHHER
jgi:hypothetical protein